MPVFSASVAKQASKPAIETVTSLTSGHKNSTKVADGDADLATLLAEVWLSHLSEVPEALKLAQPIFSYSSLHVYKISSFPLVVR